jgi:hypothetical protein
MGIPRDSKKEWCNSECTCPLFSLCVEADWGGVRGELCWILPGGSELEGLFFLPLKGPSSFEVFLELLEKVCFALLFS